MRTVSIEAPASDRSTTTIIETAPPRPGPGEVTIDVAYAGINFIDVMARRGDAGYASSWPYHPGLEVAGTIREIGPGVRSRTVGERVAAFTSAGGLAQVATASEQFVSAVPSEVSFAVAAAAPLMLSTAILLLSDIAPLRPGRTLLMHSAGGGVGSAVAQVAAALGAGSLIGTVGRADKLPAARAAGWTHAFARSEDMAVAIRRAVPGGVDVVLDPTGTTNLDLDLDVAAPGARIVLFGNPSGAVPAPLPPLGRLIAGNISLIGFSITRLRAAEPELVAGALTSGLRMIADGSVHLDVTVASLDDVGEVHDRLSSGQGVGKYVVRTDG